MTNNISTYLKSFFEIVLMVDLNEYKTQSVEKILGVNPNYLNKVLVISDVGQDALKTAEDILKTSYNSIAELTKELNKLKSDVENYLLWD